jgi:hypothetical protein
VPELLGGDNRPIRVELGLHVLIAVAPLPKLGLPYPEAILRGSVGQGQNVRFSAPSDLGQRDNFFGIVDHVQHLVCGMAYPTVLLPTLFA